MGTYQFGIGETVRDDIFGKGVVVSRADNFLYTVEFQDSVADGKKRIQVSKHRLRAAKRQQKSKE